MERLKRLSDDAVRITPMRFKRYLIDKINWDKQLIGISGARGCGKTILLLQHLKSLKEKEKAIYVSLDDVYFSKNKLIYFAEEFSQIGGKYLMLDEVHKYTNWSQEIKNIYDTLPDLKVVFTSSSALEIYKGSHDLSRRATVHNLTGLSFREFIELKYKIKFPVYSLSEILKNNSNTYANIKEQIKPLEYFNEYLKEGYYPFFLIEKEDYSNQLVNTINLVIENDLPAIYKIDFSSVIKMKKMLFIISRISPYKPNIEKLGRQTNTSRETLLKYLFYLDKAQIIQWLGSNAYGINYLNKPDKLFLGNTNIAYSLANEKPDVGSIRETFFLNQLKQNHVVTYPKQGDFLVDNKYLFEIGGKNKTQKQIKGIKNSYIAADDIEYGYKNIIPLWLFGFLY
ncbi:MAG: AAA family ATPase [Bacteroidota bacterium]|nr:AAA family ATPase [Bacteroidota bacterium]